MTEWQPTNELRFVEREVFDVPTIFGSNVNLARKTKILQQKWERYESEFYEGQPETQWRDVPVEQER